jgi:Carbonic anhydrase
VPESFCAANPLSANLPPGSGIPMEFLLLDNVCVCRTCVDPRENGFYQQHGLPVFNRFFMTRSKGAFVTKPNATNNILNTCVMLVKEGKSPMTVTQGHRDCAAVRTSYAADEKAAALLDDTDKEFLRSYEEALAAVKKYAGTLGRDDRLRVLERICVLQDINNLFTFHELADRGDFHFMAYAYYSLTPTLTEPPSQDGADIPLMIYDPEQGVFARSKHKNDGIRLIDLMDLDTFRPKKLGCRFEITKPIDLDAVVRNEVRYALAGEVPEIEANIKVSARKVG